MVKFERARIGFRSTAVAVVVSTGLIVVGVAGLLVSVTVNAAGAAAGSAPPPGAASCSGCHPASPHVTSPVPRLAGRDQAAIVQAVKEFRSGKRAGTVMDRIAKGFTDEEVQAIAAWYAAQR
jgi:cytochrome subunit of sulfide dehydrogenase